MAMESCPACASRVAPHHNFCGACGAPLPGGTSAAGPPVELEAAEGTPIGVRLKRERLGKLGRALRAFVRGFREGAREAQARRQAKRFRERAREAQLLKSIQESAEKKETVVARLIMETKNTCKACGKVWFYGKRDVQLQRAAKMQNVSKALMCCGGCFPAALISEEKVVDLSKCPECGSKAALSEEVSHEV